MDNHRIRRPINPFRAEDEELRSFIEGETTGDIVRRVSDAFAEELSDILKGNRRPRTSVTDPEEQRHP